jgi:putative Mg2+ transporter-C (MgtC) family protein
MIEQYFGPNSGRFLLSIILSIIAGVLVGTEKELRGKDAGVRTHTFVVVGSMVFTYISSLFVNDQARIAAQIVTGIGFLGAGIILKAQSGHVQNLTTAASIWVSAAIGMAFGFGLYFEGIILTIVAIFISWLPHVRPKKHKPVLYYNDENAAKLVNI